MKTLKLSVVLAARNEQEKLGRCLESVKTIADEIVIADEKSTDKTVEIAKKFGTRVIPVSHQDNFHITKNVSIDNAKGEWILQLDADEVVSPELAQEITIAIKDGQSPINGYWINRRNWFLTRFLSKGGQYPDPTLRLYRRGLGRLPAKDVHEQATVEPPIGHLKHDLLHYRDTSFEKYMEGFNRYSSFISSQLENKKVNFGLTNTFLYLFLKPLSTFLGIYIRHRGYVDGTPGFIFAVFSGLIHPVSYIKYWQHTKYPS
ncbi:hypothetical protein A3D85_01925 [Candidatus Amesbacteria bacterium RIFCSPHIGHO2_02_FULL_47_9]|uniref:Glycosyltransferase 2-like domain-containing protein n=1 Tax=Candidatus Amesbacteria bacterium RIFCSPHIGHO2_01_FULL_48_32b TaxID=1797253 RepID=A0A1F4YDY9_9BACT|nr:MAG: hypothetical protein A2876_02595 [Candidatus Amesbacteria bacterium RIFCSPHIGHO2_01_FULL_48_32b]OGD04525.1 MAG: hypothetical protein A3D85_01925 [Candidatus Amesbacteria bacterium RIFCSPHIGHO2_02_FULL_47_9]OGD08105.1 MAG: hypothetical protein A2899_02040 [Candidatus Amesbacteria bacterium RIFCSPLOWO2_01_FULL_49_25]